MTYNKILAEAGAEMAAEMQRRSLPPEPRLRRPEPQAATNADAAPPLTRAGILDEAKRITTADRNDTYGEPEDLFAEIGAYWSTYLAHQITATDVAVMMALMKVARINAAPRHADSWIDAAGYIACGAEVAGRAGDIAGMQGRADCAGKG